MPVLQVKRVKASNLGKGACVFATVPDEIVVILASFLPIEDRVHLSITCKYLRYLFWGNNRRVRKLMWKDVINKGKVKMILYKHRTRYQG